MATPNNHSDAHFGKSGEARRKESPLTLGDLCVCPEEPDWGTGDVVRRTGRSQQRPQYSNRLWRRSAESFIQGAALRVARDMERPQVAGCQMEFPLDAVSHGAFGGGGTGTEASEERQLSPAAEKKRTLTQDLMEWVASLANLSEAVRRVCRNKGAAGADGMTFRDLKCWFAAHWRELRCSCCGAPAVPSPYRMCRYPNRAGECASWAFQRWRTGWRNRRCSKCSNRFGPRPFRRAVSDFVREGASVRPGTGIHARAREPCHRGGPGFGEVLRPGEP